MKHKSINLILVTNMLLLLTYGTWAMDKSNIVSVSRVTVPNFMAGASPDKQLFFTTVRIEASNGTNRSVGTGSLFDYQWNWRGSSNKVHGTFLVSNAHVIDGYPSGKITFIKRKADSDEPKLGETMEFTMSNWTPLWHRHSKADLVVMPLAPLLNVITNDSLRPYFRLIDRAISACGDEQRKLRAMEQVIFIGYPSALFDSKNFLPLARRGYTASPLGVDYENEKKFVVDAAVFPGSSGSPVFVYDQGAFLGDAGEPLYGQRAKFVGIITSMYYRNEKGRIMLREVPTAFEPYSITKQPLNLGVVLKADLVYETIEQLLRRNGDLK